MTVRTFALIYGIVFLLVGIAGFVPALVEPGTAAAGEPEWGLLFGLFPVNTLHNLVHAVFGIWGIAVYRNYSAAVQYARIVAVVYAIFTIMGLIPGLQTLFGLVPLHHHDVWLHALLAAVAAYFGFVRAGEPTSAPRHV